MNNKGEILQRVSKAFLSLAVPLLALLVLIIFNIIRDPGFFSISTVVDSYGNTVLAGNLISILNGASELAILAMGMTLVTAASRGQDISVGATAAIAGSVFVKVLLLGQITEVTIFLAFLASCGVAMLFGAFNGALVAIFKIQPMIATLIMFTTGRAIAYWINGGATPVVDKEPLAGFGGFVKGFPVPSSIILVVACGVIFALALRFTNLGLYTQAVGINEKSAHLNGINPIWIKLLAFIILGLCCAVAAAINVGKLGLINHETILIGIEMDAILAVAIGGNSLGGGKFNMVGSVIGAYVIQCLTTTLYAMKVPSTDIKAYKAIVIIAIVVVGSPIVKEAVSRLWGRLHAKKDDSVLTEDI
ncbi:MAG: ABC transporter permease [Clostridiales bacterium]|nr:ABC transporter permease [Clostridiales bacterium]